jgi:predicted metal-dependent RNase
VIDGKAIPVRCKYEQISGFSSHADTTDLALFLNNFKKHH